MNTSVMLPSERTTYTDAETARKVTIWTAPGTGHNVGLYYHQNPFDRRRNLVYFVANRTGAWQLWRMDQGDGRLMQVSDFDGLGRMLAGSTVNQGGANYWVNVSPRSGRPFIGGNGRIAVIDPDTLDCRVLWETHISDEDRTTRFFSQSYVFPSCDDRWVYSYGIYASRDEMAAAQALSKAVCEARKAAGQRVHAQYAEALHGMTESPLEQVVFRIEVATGRMEELWRGHWWLQHLQASPTDPDLVSFLWGALMRPKPKYFLLRAGEAAREIVADELNACNFHDFWHPDGTRWLTHRCENLDTANPEVYAPIPGKMRFLVRDVEVTHFTATGKVRYRDWYESAGEKHVHLHLNIAPDGSFLVGDGQSDCPFICRLDWQDDGTIPATPLCRTEYAPWSETGQESNPNVHVSPDGKACFFTTCRDGKACLASVETD